MLSKLFTRRLKGGIEKQGSGLVGWLLPPQLWGKVGMGGVVAGIAPIPHLPCRTRIPLHGNAVRQARRIRRETLASPPLPGEGVRPVSKKLRRIKYEALR